MDDFKSYQGGKKDGEKEKSERAQFEAQAKKMAQGYNGKNEGDLMREIYARALEGKKNGTLSNAEIDAFVRQFAPMLDPVKRKKLYKIAESLKKI